MISVEGSLKKLKTSYIDILYIHYWDWSTSVEEFMNGLHTLITQGKVLYLVCLDCAFLIYCLDLTAKYREPVTYQHSWLPRLTSMLATTVGQSSSSTKESGTSSSEMSSAKSCFFVGWTVCANTLC